MSHQHQLLLRYFTLFSELTFSIWCAMYALLNFLCVFPWTVEGAVCISKAQESHLCLPMGIALNGAVLSSHSSQDYLLAASGKTLWA